MVFLPFPALFGCVNTVGFQVNSLQHPGGVLMLRLLLVIHVGMSLYLTVKIWYIAVELSGEDIEVCFI